MSFLNVTYPREKSVISSFLEGYELWIITLTRNLNLTFDLVSARASKPKKEMIGDKTWTLQSERLESTENFQKQFLKLVWQPLSYMDDIKR